MHSNSLNLFSLMLIATVPYVGKRLHLDPDLDSDPDPDPKLITDPDPNMQIISDPAGSGSTTLHCWLKEKLRLSYYGGKEVCSWYCALGDYSYYLCSYFMFRWNKFEAVMCVELTNYLLKQGLPAGQITILTPYSSQLRYTRDWLPVR